LKQSLEDEISADTKDMEEEKSLKAASEENKANAEGDLAETIKELNKDKASLDEASTTCMQVAADHEATVKSRNEELNAIATAEKVLKEVKPSHSGTAPSWAKRARMDMRIAMAKPTTVRLKSSMKDRMSPRARFPMNVKPPPGRCCFPREDPPGWPPVGAAFLSTR